MDKETSTLLLLGVAHSLNHSLFLVLPPLLKTISNELDASFQTLGVVATVTFFIFGTGALVGGPLSDRLGSVKVARVSIGLGGAMTLVFLLAENIYTFGAGMFLMALWASFYHPTANNLIARAFKSNTGEAMGIHNAAGNFGQAFTPTVAFLLGIWFNWRLSFIFFGLLSLVTAALMARIVVDDGGSEGEDASLMEFFHIPNLWLILVYNVLVGLLFRSVDLFFPTFLSVERGFAGGIAAVANSAILLSGVVGQLVGGRGSDRYGSTRVLVGSSLGMVASLVLLLLLPTSVWGVWLFVALYGVAMFSHQPSMTALVGQVSPLNFMGLAYGVMFFSTFGVGSISTTITGYLADAYSLTVAFWMNALVALGLLVVSLLMYLKMRG